MTTTIHQSLRDIAYSPQRTGNPRCVAEAKEIHARLDAEVCPVCGFPTEQRACAAFCQNCGYKGVCGERHLGELMEAVDSR